MSRFRLFVVVLVIALAIPSVSSARGWGRSYGYYGGYAQPYQGTYTYYHVTAPWGATIGGGTVSGYGVPMQPVYVAPVYPVYSTPSYYFNW